MVDTTLSLGLGSPPSQVDGRDWSGAPPSDLTSIVPSMAAAARYDAFVAGEATASYCNDYLKPGHDFDRCVRDSVSNAVLFRAQTGDLDAVDEADVQQVGLGDCHVMASLGALAATPEGRALIKGAIVENRNDKGEVDSWTVTLHHPERRLVGQTTFQDVKVTVRAPFTVGHAAARVDGNQSEIWPLVMEKAYAQYAGGYNNIARGGCPADVMTILTGHEATIHSFGGLFGGFASYGGDELRADVAAGRPVVLSTKDHLGTGGVDAHGLVDEHAYFVEAIEEHQGKLFVKLGNPWGSSQPDSIPCDQLPKLFAGASVGSLR